MATKSSFFSHDYHSNDLLFHDLLMVTMLKIAHGYNIPNCLLITTFNAHDLPLKMLLVCSRLDHPHSYHSQCFVSLSCPWLLYDYRAHDLLKVLGSLVLRAEGKIKANTMKIFCC